LFFFVFLHLSTEKQIKFKKSLDAIIRKNDIKTTIAIILKALAALSEVSYFIANCLRLSCLAFSISFNLVIL
jgi:hypothetical protein